MSEYLTRFYSGDLEIRGAEGRTLWGVMCPFDSPASIRDAQGSYMETFQRGAFSRSINNRGDRIPAYAKHQHHNLPIGVVRDLTESDKGLIGEMYVSKTRDGDEILELVRDGAMRSFSIGFSTVPDKDVWSPARDAVIRTEVNLREVSVVDMPAYENATIAGVRNIVIDGVTYSHPVTTAGGSMGMVDLRSTPDTPEGDSDGPAATDPDSPAHSGNITAVQARTRAFLLRRNPSWMNSSSSGRRASTT